MKYYPYLSVDHIISKNVKLCGLVDFSQQTDLQVSISLKITSYGTKSVV